MKTCLITSTLLFLLSNLSVAQSNNYDPFLGNYELGGRADLVWFNANLNSSGFEIGHWAGTIAQDFQENDSVISTDGVSGNFLMGTVSQQRRDEAVLGTMEAVGDSVVLVRLYVDQYVDGKWTVVPETIDSYKQKPITANDRMLVRMTSGYFDGGPAKEFAIAYDLPDGSNLITIRAFKLDSITGRPIQIASVRDNKLPAGLGTQALFDITAGNFEGNGRDQLVLVENNALLDYYTTQYGSGLGFVASLKFDSYDFDWTTHQLVSKDITTRRDTCVGWSSLITPGYPPVADRLTQLVICSGDFNGDGRDECACGFAYFSYFENGGAPLPCVSYYVQPFSLAGDLASFSINANNLVDLDNYQMWDTTPSSLADAQMSMAVGDLLGNGKQQLVVSDLEGLSVDTLTSSLSLTSLANYQEFSKTFYASHHAVAIADIDGDTTFTDSASSNWRPELIFAKFSKDPSTDPTTESNNTPLIYFDKVAGTSPFKLANLMYVDGDYSNTVTPDIMGDGGILLGDFRGNSVRLGSPKFQALTSLIEPAIIINAPPVGFDVIGDSTYNISGAYPINNSSDPFYSTIGMQNSSEAQVSTDTHSSWGVSSTLSAGGDFLGIGVKASFTAKYGQDFDKTQENDSTFTVTQYNTTQWDDLIYATVTDYDIWQYPVYADGVLKGHIMAAIAHPKGLIWFGCDESGYGNNIILDHEPGNLLSYPDYNSSDLTSDPDIRPGGLIYVGAAHLINETSSSQNYEEFNWSTMTNTSVAKTESYGFSASASVEGWGVSLETEGDYNHDAVKTHTTTFTQSIDMEANYGNVSSNTEEYTVTPYAYWSVNGALVLDYSVDFPSSSQMTSFWDAHYQEPDLTWNCYYRYFVQKGFAGLSQEMADWTKEIQIFPSTPREGDTVTVLAEIHNYSLKQTPGNVQVRFYLSNSDSGGIPVVDLSGDSVFTTSPVAARGDQMINFKWKIPAGLTTSDSVLYGVIDPDNQITEVNKDNNKGWNSITILGTTPTAVHSPANVVRSFRLLQNYPNPFNPTTMIDYQLSSASKVTLKVYDILGMEVATLVNQMEGPGTYDVRFNGSRLASGVYFYRIIAKGANGRNFVAVKKLMLLK